MSNDPDQITAAIERLRKTVRNTGFALGTLALAILIMMDKARHFGQEHLAIVFQTIIIAGGIVLGTMLLFYGLRRLFDFEEREWEEQKEDSEAQK